MVLKERKCPNCGSNGILEKDGIFVCMNCRTFFDNPNDIKITHINRDEVKIERIRARERMQKEENKNFLKILTFLFGAFIVMYVLVSIFK